MRKYNLHSEFEERVIFSWVNTRFVKMAIQTYALVSNNLLESKLKPDIFALLKNAFSFNRLKATVRHLVDFFLENWIIEKKLSNSKYF